MAKTAKQTKPTTFTRRFIFPFIALLFATAIWLPTVHLFYIDDIEIFRSDTTVSPRAKKLSQRFLRLWQDPTLRQQQTEHIRQSNAEWDFMARTFLVMSLANMSELEPDRTDEYLAVMDQIIDDTLAVENERGVYHFLMPYARYGPFIQKPVQSQFVDGEIAMMLAVRNVIKPDDHYRQLLSERVAQIVHRMSSSPVLNTESYPDECWMFCNTFAAAAVKISDYLEGTDHSDFLNQWITVLKQKLTDPQSSLLISSFSYDGDAMDGPEGSSIWIAAHCLDLIDEQFARKQYQLAKTQLRKRIAGFGFAREWPESWRGHMDIDSGPIIPVLDVSAGASGLAFVGAAAFHDDQYMQELMTTLNFAGFAWEKQGRLQYCASNQVGDAVLLYSMVTGPIWDKVKNGDQK